MADGRFAGRETDLEVERLDAASVSLTFYFTNAPHPVPDFLAGLRKRNPKVHAFGWHHFVERSSYVPRMSEIRNLIGMWVSKIPAEVDKRWLEEQACEIRLYVSVHPGAENGSLGFSNETLAQLVAIGATVEIDVI